MTSHTEAQVRCWSSLFLIHKIEYPFILGEACFVCEVASETENTQIDGHADCSRCGPAAKIDWENTQRVLEHMGAHILYDAKLNCTEERCGLCLRPATMCPIYCT
jgi:hypothetical protein